MSPMKMQTATSMSRRLPHLIAVATLLFGAVAEAAAPGILGSTLTTGLASFDLAAQPAYITQPDGQMVYSWGYGCNSAPSGFAPAAISGASCSAMQIPGPTLIVTEGQTVSVTLHNNLPTAAGNTSRSQRRAVLPDC
jgi:FtsP/CotA-like multicopper oxidase with cupredoxin domain